MASHQNIEKCLKAIKEVCQKAVPCIKTSIRSWQQKHQLSLGNCTGMGACPSTGGKPKANKKCCASCVSWGKALEAEIYSSGGQIQWSNINPTLLSTDPFEVAKAFVLRLKTGKTYSTFGDLDSASLLMIMMGFKEFHQSDQGSHSVIKKVAETRNILAHLSIDSDRYVNNTTRDRYFDDIRDLVDLLEQLHPSTFTSDTAQGVHDEVNNIHSSPLVAASPRHLATGTCSVFICISLLLIILLFGFVVHGLGENGACKSSPCYYGICRELTDDYYCNCNEGYTGRNCEKVEEPFTVSSIQNQLRTLYIDKRGKIPLFPGIPDNFADMQEFYINLELEEVRKGQVGTINRRLNSHQELIALQSQSGYELKRLLASGVAGVGKTTLVSKLAYDWAREMTYFSGFEMLFVIDIRYVKAHMDLIDVLQNQLLSRLSRQGMLDYLKDNASSAIFIFDGFDEGSQQFVHSQRDIEDVFKSTWLQHSLVLVTTRPHKVDEFMKTFGVYAKVKLHGFSAQNVDNYVDKFTTAGHMNKEERHKLGDFKAFLLNDGKMHNLYSIPIMLSMVCIVWNQNHILPDRITPLYENAFMFLAKHKGYAAYADNKTLLTLIAQGLGKPALLHLLEQEDQLIFKPYEFNSTLLDHAIRIGIVSKERHYFDSSVEHVLFLHKTFQEYCAAVYFVSLLNTHRDLFDKYLQEMSREKPKYFDILLRFSCGLSHEAASAITSHLVYLFPPQTELCFYQSCPGNETLDFGLIQSLLYEAHDCELFELLQPIFTHVRKLCLNTYISFGWSSTNGSDKIFWSPLEFVLSCISKSEKGKLCKTLFDNVIEAYLMFDERTLKFLNALACRPLQKFKFDYECSHIQNYLEYEYDIHNSLSNLTLVSEGRDSDPERRVLYIASCLTPLVQAIHSLFNKWGHRDHVSLRELLLINVDVDVDNLLDLLFQQIRLVQFEFIDTNMFGENCMSKLLKALVSSPLQILKISSNIMEGNVTFIEPFLPTLKILTLHNVQYPSSTQGSLIMHHDEHSAQNVWDILCEAIIRKSASIKDNNAGYDLGLPLEELDVSYNDLSQKLSMLPSILQCLPRFRLLSIQNTNLIADDIKQFYMILVNSWLFPTLVVLDISVLILFYHRFKSIEKVHILAVLQLLCWFFLFPFLSPTFLTNLIYCKQSLQVQDLDLSKNNLVQSMPWLIATIKCMPDLKVLNLQETSLGVDDMIALKQSITYGIPCLQNLNLDCRFHMPLKELDLSGNYFHGGVDHLTTALKCFPQLQNLKLGDDNMYPNLESIDIKELSLGLHNMPNLKALDIRSIDMSDSNSMKYLSVAISSHKNLHELRLDRTTAKCEFILTFEFAQPWCFSDSCMLRCAYVKNLLSNMLCSVCPSTGYLHFENDATVSRNQSNSIDKSRFEFQTDNTKITVLNLGTDDIFVCYNTGQPDYLNCLVNDNNLKALDMCKRLSHSLGIILNV